MGLLWGSSRGVNSVGDTPNTLYSVDFARMRVNCGGSVVRCTDFLCFFGVHNLDFAGLGLYEVNFGVVCPCTVSWIKCGITSCLLED